MAQTEASNSGAVDFGWERSDETSEASQYRGSTVIGINTLVDNVVISRSDEMKSYTLALRVRCVLSRSQSSGGDGACLVRSTRL